MRRFFLVRIVSSDGRPHFVTGAFVRPKAFSKRTEAEKVAKKRGPFAKRTEVLEVRVVKTFRKRKA